MSEWQPIETAPRDESRIWCGWSGGDYMTYLFWSESRQAWCAGDGGYGQDRYSGEDAPTHWMPKNPIPPPPL